MLWRILWLCLLKRVQQRGEAAPRCLPSVDFAAKHVAQVLAFLIRNRGKLDTDVVREKWKHLDRFSLPLAVYLRDIEASGEWAALEDEIAASPPPLRRNSYSNKHAKILKLIAAWERRGEELLKLIATDASTVAAASDSQLDDDDAPPGPTRP